MELLGKTSMKPNKGSNNVHDMGAFYLSDLPQCFLWIGKKIYTLYTHIWAYFGVAWCCIGSTPPFQPYPKAGQIGPQGPHEASANQLE